MNNVQFVKEVFEEIIKANGGSGIVLMLLNEAMGKVSEDQAKRVVDMVREKLREYDNSQSLKKPTVGLALKSVFD